MLHTLHDLDSFMFGFLSTELTIFLFFMMRRKGEVGDAADQRRERNRGDVKEKKIVAVVGQFDRDIGGMGGSE